jgi:hypothetical protein
MVLSPSHTMDISSTGISVAVPCSHVALLDPVLGKHDQGAGHGLGRHGLGPIRFGTARDWQRAEVGLATGQGLAVGMAALRVQGLSHRCWRPTRLLLGHNTGGVRPICMCFKFSVQYAYTVSQSGQK